MWSSTRDAYQSGAFGNPQDIDTQILYWATMERYHYPNAGNICNTLKDKKAQQEQMIQAQQTLAPTGGDLQQAGRGVGALDLNAGGQLI